MNNIYDSLLSSAPQKSSLSSSKKTFLMLAASIMVVFCLMQVFQTQSSTIPSIDNEAMALHTWERVYLDCDKCPTDQFRIISATFGDEVITGDFNQRYNNGERSFVATNEYWGIESWPEARKKTLVLTFAMCGNYNTKIITEGQTLILPE